MNPTPAADLRQEAERRLRERNTSPIEGMPEVDVRALLHELQVHQIELEMQNEELQRSHAARQRAEETVRESEAGYRSLFEHMLDGYAYCRMLFDEQGRPQDFIYLAVNDAFGRLTGLEDVIGRRATEVIPGIKEMVPEMFEFYGRVASTGKPERCDIALAPLGLWLSVSAYRPAKDCFVAVFDNITHRKQAEETLEEQARAAQAANAAKSQFLANMSHELRTPMNAILGMLDVALPKAADPHLQDCLQTARDSAGHLLTLLNDLLDSAKIESGKLGLESAPFSLRRMLDELTRALSQRAGAKRLRFFCRTADTVPDAVVGDRMRLLQVLLNLAGNAIKFTESGEVAVSVEVASGESGKRGTGGHPEGTRQGAASREQRAGSGERGENCKLQIANCKSQISDFKSEISDPQTEMCDLRFAIRDTGIGIPPSAQERLFQPFSQADASMARRFGGTGLGLSICKSLVEMMGGRIWVESQVGKGSTFYFTVCLPVTKELPADSEAPPASLSPMAAAPLRILLVEDNPANQKLAAYLLQERGHTVEIAGNGHEAIYLTAEHAYDVVLMDVQMPEMDGLQATAEIRGREYAGGPAGGKRVPIVAITAHSLRGDREQCLTAGMDAYISKPIDRQELIETVERLAEKGDARSQISDFTSQISDLKSQLSNSLPFSLDEALARLGGQAELFRDMVDFFFSDGWKLLQEIQEGAAAGDAAAMERKAHKLKGTVLYLGAEAATEAVAAVEALARSGDLTGAVPAIDSMEKEMTRLAEALRSYRAVAPMQGGT